MHNRVSGTLSVSGRQPAKAQIVPEGGTQFNTAKRLKKAKVGGDSVQIHHGEHGTSADLRNTIAGKFFLTTSFHSRDVHYVENVPPISNDK